MRSPSILLFVSVLLAGTTSAQQTFDLILPSKVTVSSGGGAPAARTGIVVNTGSVPLSSADWGIDGLSIARTSTELSDFDLFPHEVVPWTLQPGEATGDAAALLQALLLPGEALTFAIPVLSIEFSASSELNATVTGHIQIGTERVDFTVDVEVVAAPMGLTTQTAQRISSQTVPPSITELPTTCSDFPGGAATMRAVPLVSHPPGPYMVSRTATMPALDNPYFGVDVRGLLPAAELGAVWLYSVAVSNPSFDLLGCELYGWDVPIIGGDFQLTDSLDVAPVPSAVPLPLPDVPAAAGLQLTFQYGVISPNAVNGLFAASNALLMRIEQL